MHVHFLKQRWQQTTRLEEKKKRPSGKSANHSQLDSLLEIPSWLFRRCGTLTPEEKLSVPNILSQLRCERTSERHPIAAPRQTQHRSVRPSRKLPSIQPEVRGYTGSLRTHHTHRQSVKGNSCRCSSHLHYLREQSERVIDFLQQQTLLVC